MNEGTFKTFSHGYSTSGDIVYLPFGHIFTEKATSSHTISLRSPCMMTHLGQAASAELLSLAYPELLDNIRGGQQNVGCVTSLSINKH